ncbi:MAG: hypothetical protein FWD89_00965 [Firmicutes bacterium]|nr:hypothetical protein [Bacillota bacterium]MCL2770865.1 hypothetical protein [Bacillota bacterium]
MADKKITNPKKALEFMLYNRYPKHPFDVYGRTAIDAMSENKVEKLIFDHDRQKEYISAQWEKYGLDSLSRDSGRVSFNGDAIHPDVFKNKYFLNGIMDWMKNEGKEEVREDGGVLKFIEKGFPYKFREQNPEIMKEISGRFTEAELVVPEIPRTRRFSSGTPTA